MADQVGGWEAVLATVVGWASLEGEVGGEMEGAQEERGTEACWAVVAVVVAPARVAVRVQRQASTSRQRWWPHQQHPPQHMTAVGSVEPAGW